MLSRALTVILLPSRAGARVLRADIAETVREHDAHALESPSNEPGELGRASTTGGCRVRPRPSAAAQRLREGHPRG